MLDRVVDRRLCAESAEKKLCIKTKTEQKNVDVCCDALRKEDEVGRIWQAPALLGTRATTDDFIKTAQMLLGSSSITHHTWPSF